MEDDDSPIEGPCPFCARTIGGRIRCDFDVMTLRHTLPVCPDFRDRTADEFVQAVIDGKHWQ